MKHILLHCSLITATCLVSGHLAAQLNIQPGAYWNHSGNVYTVLSDVDLVNNGNLVHTAGTVKFAGSGNNYLQGSAIPAFNSIEIARNGTATLYLQQNCSVDQTVTFTSGLIDLNGKVIALSPAATLVNENGSSRITGTSGGYVTITTNLTAPVGSNPGNLGAVITTTNNLGSTVIKRGHTSQQNGNGLGNTIYRYYDITPTNDVALNATLRFNYFDEELNGLTESNLVVWKSADNSHWASQGYSGRNTTTNYVDRDAITDFSRWTLSSVNNALPVIFSLFNVQCKNNTTVIRWATAQEQNTQRFEVESSTDGVHWQVIGAVAAAGNSNTEQQYTFTDGNPPGGGVYYRVIEHDINNNAHYTGIVHNDCGATDGYRVWPNPFTQFVYVNISVSQPTAFALKVYDDKGALIQVLNKKLQAGSNQLPVNLAGKAKGIYHLVGVWNGQIRKVVTVVKGE